MDNAEIMAIFGRIFFLSVHYWILWDLLMHCNCSPRKCQSPGQRAFFRWFFNKNKGEQDRADEWPGFWHSICKVYRAVGTVAWSNDDTRHGRCVNDKLNAAVRTHANYARSVFLRGYNDLLYLFAQYLEFVNRM